MSDAGEPLMPMVADREHLYGRDVIPLAFLAQVTGDRSATAACERSPWPGVWRRHQQYPPTHRVAKFSGEPSTSGGAPSRHRYLFHRVAVPLRPPGRTPDAEGVVRAGRWGRGLRDGPRSGGASDAPGLGRRREQGRVREVRLAARPRRLAVRAQRQHPVFLPSTAAKVTGRKSVVAYAKGGTASRRVPPCSPSTAPGTPGSPRCRPARWSTRRPARAEGVVKVHNLDMPGMPG